MERVQNDIESFFTREATISHQAYDELDLMNKFNPVERVSVLQHFDSLGRKTFQMPIVYDPIQKRLVKTLEQ